MSGGDSDIYQTRWEEEEKMKEEKVKGKQRADRRSNDSGKNNVSKTEGVEQGSLEGRCRQIAPPGGHSDTNHPELPVAPCCC